MPDISTSKWGKSLLFAALKVSATTPSLQIVSRMVPCHSFAQDRYRVHFSLSLVLRTTLTQFNWRILALFVPQLSDSYDPGSTFADHHS